MLKIHCLSVALLFAGGVALAQAPKPGSAPPAGAAAPPPAAAPPAAGAPAGPPKPAKEFEDFMKGFDGSWKCETKWAAGAMGPGSPEVTGKSNVKFKKDLDGFFYRGDYEVKKQKGIPMNFKGTFYLGYDPGGAQLVVSAMDNMGGASFGTGKIEGDKVTYVSDGFMMGQKVKAREVLGKTGPKEGFHTMEIDMGKGFQPFGEDRCKK
jgi:hypothetical protein